MSQILILQKLFYEINLLQALDEERIFVQYIEEMDDVINAPDLSDRNASDDRVLSSFKSPIALFVLKDDGMLTVFAIQTDSNTGQYPTID